MCVTCAYKNATQPKNDLLNNFDLACISINLLILFIISHTYTCAMFSFFSPRVSFTAFISCCQLLCCMFGNFVVSSRAIFFGLKKDSFHSRFLSLSLQNHKHTCILVWSVFGIDVGKKQGREWQQQPPQQQQDT